ncbi:MAG: YjfB family protein [Zoogloeaceae bacterium]|nr:YjfB family protein [Zoogloeaceae bacterium]
MDVSSIAAFASANAMANARQEVSLSVLKKAMDIQEQSAMQLLEALPPVPAPSTGAAGGVIDTWV